jgi:preprotein translocase subunit YajC
VDFISKAFGGGADGAQSSIMSFLPLILMFAVLYFIMIRPQMKRQKEHRNMLGAMAKGDEVVTNGGIVGKVTKVTDAYVGVEIAEGTEITIQKAAVTTILPKGTISRCKANFSRVRRGLRGQLPAHRRTHRLPLLANSPVRPSP